MKYCPNCGNVLSEGATFCSNCGNRLDGGANRGMSAARPVVENRGIVSAVLLSIFTCGIYSIIWFISIVNDVNRVCNDEKSSQSGGTVFLLTLLTCGIYGIIWFYQAGKRLSIAGEKYNVQIDDNSVLYLILSILKLDIVNYCIIQSDLNKFSNQ